MSVASHHVYVQVRLDPMIGLGGRLSAAIEDAIQRAIQLTMNDIANFATGGQSQVPVKTGRLRESFSVWATPRSIKFLWSALSPQGYDYAKIQDIGGRNRYGYIAGKYYSDVTSDFARVRFRENLIAMLQGVAP